MDRVIGWNGQVKLANSDGCPNCNKGRVGIHELMPTSKELLNAINQEAETAVLKGIVMRNSMKTCTRTAC